MKVLALEIEGFRGIPSGRLVLGDQVAIVGANGAGKSTIVDALSLVFGRQKLVSELTEHDFFGSSPGPADRIRIVATVGGFPANTASESPSWFRSGRSVEKWWDPIAKTAGPVERPGAILCAQIAYAARFDHEDLTVKQIRYFQQHDAQVDPFDDEVTDRFPDRLLSDVGFFVLPARRTWAAAISFGSELFRKAVATLGGVPADTVLRSRDELRGPQAPLEQDEAIRPLVEKINSRIAKLLPGNPELQLRLTSTDAESVLRALVPHYRRKDSVSLPVHRHGTGLISLQTLVLLLEIGRARRAAGQSFILVLEEPELHVPPGMQRRVIGDAAAISDQILCTTHAPRVAAFFPADSIQILARKAPLNVQREGVLEGRPLAANSMIQEPNPLVQLYTDHRTQLIESLMFQRVLVPEGRVDYEWLRLMLDVSETGSRPVSEVEAKVPPFGAVIGVVPTRTSAMKITFDRLRQLHDHVGVLVDGDSAGDTYVKELLKSNPAPCSILQWPTGWTIEHVVKWILEAEGDSLLAEINLRLQRSFSSWGDFLTALGNEEARTGGLKTHYMAHEEISGVMRNSAPCVKRADQVLDALVCTMLDLGSNNNLEVIGHEAAMGTTMRRFRP